jgi:hypothetical protein
MLVFRHPTAEGEGKRLPMQHLFCKPVATANQSTSPDNVHKSEIGVRQKSSFYRNADDNRYIVQLGKPPTVSGYEWIPRWDWKS